MTIETRKLDRRFVGFASRIAEESAVHPGESAQALGELLLLGNLVQIRHMHRTSSLCGNGCDQPRMGMPYARDRNAAYAVEISFAFQIPEPRAVAPRERDRLPAISRHHVLHHVAHPAVFPGSKKHTAAKSRRACYRKCWGFQAPIFIRIGARMQALYPCFTESDDISADAVPGDFFMPRFYPCESNRPR